jgi:hypothetical protein
VLQDKRHQLDEEQFALRICMSVPATLEIASSLLKLKKAETIQFQQREFDYIKLPITGYNFKSGWSQYTNSQRKLFLNNLMPFMLSTKKEMNEVEEAHYRRQLENVQNSKRNLSICFRCKR